MDEYHFTTRIIVSQFLQKRLRKTRNFYVIDKTANIGKKISCIISGSFKKETSFYLGNYLKNNFIGCLTL